MSRFRVWMTERKSVLIDAFDYLEAIDAAQTAFPGADIDEVKDADESMSGEDILDASQVLAASRGL